MDFFKVVAPVYDTAMKISGHNKTLKELVDHIELESGQRLLDIGGGTGQILEEIPQDKGIQVVIADPSKAMLSKARKRVADLDSKALKGGERQLQADLVKAFGNQLPLADKSFDHVTIADALHHFNNIEETFKEIRRVLKSDGKLYIMEFDPGTYFTKFIAAAEGLAGEPANFYKPELLGTMLEKAGFSYSFKYITGSIYILTAE
ncbi:MAG: class I SAM-dependent methyltransferase [Bacillota bacterium]